MTTPLCPVCAMPTPLGLTHCSLACEEKDPPTEEEADFGCDRCGGFEPNPECWLCMEDPKIGPAPVEGASDGSD